MLKLNKGKGRPGKKLLLATSQLHAKSTEWSLVAHGLLNQHCKYLKALAQGMCFISSSFE